MHKSNSCVYTQPQYLLNMHSQYKLGECDSRSRIANLQTAVHSVQGMALTVVSKSDDFMWRLQSQGKTVIPNSLTWTGVVVYAILIELQAKERVKWEN